MTAKISPLLADPRSDIGKSALKVASYLAETRMNTGSGRNLLVTSDRPKVGQGSDIREKLLTAMQVAEFLACSTKTVRRNCEAGKYAGAKKELGNGGMGWMIPISSALTPAQHAKYLKAQQQNSDSLSSPVLKATLKLEVVPAAQSSQEAEYRQMWDRFERKDGKIKRFAQDALTVLTAYLSLRETGVSVGFAERAIEQSHGVSRSTIRRYLGYTENYPRQHWLPLLCPQYKGGRGRAEFTQAAYDFILALRIKSPATKLRVLIRSAKKEGAGKGWILPSEDTIAKRLREEPAYLFQGVAALERSFPTVERDYASLEIHECWESDGRKADVFCVWPDGTLNRPFVIAIRDVRSRKVLSLRICYAPDIRAAE